MKTYLIEYGPTQYTENGQNVTEVLAQAFGDSTPEGVRDYFDRRAGEKPSTVSVSLLDGQEKRPLLKFFL